MSDTKLAATLKSRLSEWQGYMEQANSARQQAPDREEAPAPPRREEEPVAVSTTISAEPLPALYVTDSLMERYESQIADLRAALEHERAQARRLAENLAREQTLNVYPRQTQASSRREYRTSDYRQAGARRSRDGYVLSEKDPRSVVLWLVVVLTVSGLCSLVAFAVLH